ncbi:MAG: hypothetical protein ACRC1R_09895 [Cetobacterium sp.]|uniref:hypothetical protein n=1 Tax=Cetobacterium sp. TaxID=2071632 RepID=UPI003F389C87
MKKLLLLIGITVMIGGCNDIVLRKDLQPRVAFENNLKEGNYKLVFYKLEYPEKQDEKMEFLEKFKVFLANNPHLNIIVPEELGKDMISIINNGGYGEEKIALKPAVDLTKEEEIQLKELVNNIEVPQGGGEIQKNINRQYYLLLALQERAEEYDPDFYYTELDKEKVIGDTLVIREELKNQFQKSLKNIVFTYDKSFDNLKNPLYLENVNEHIENINSSIILTNNSEKNGYSLINNKIILYVGNKGSKVEGFRNFVFSSEIKEIKNLKEIILNEGIEVSDLNIWKSLDQPLKLEAKN